MTVRRLVLNVGAPIGAVLFAFVVSGIFLAASGNDALGSFAAMWDYGTQADSIISALNRALPLYMSAMAVAIGFKMGLFNIGVEGQYQLAALVAAWVAGVIALPAPLHVLVVILVAMAVGATWAGIAGVLKVTRGVHEVISTIMLNAIVTTGLAAYLLRTHFAQVNQPGDLIIKTPEIPPSGRLPSVNPLLEFLGIEHGQVQLRGFIFVAIGFGILYHLLINRTRFGYDLRISGLNPGAAKAAGVNANSMVVKAMLLSGAVAGLVGLPDLLGFLFKYSIDFPTFLGFNGIAVALLGRNHPVGMAAGAVLFGWFDRAAQILDLRGVPKEIARITQGIVLLSVVVVYEVVRRQVIRLEVEAASRAHPGGPEPSLAEGWPKISDGGGGS